MLDMIAKYTKDLPPWECPSERPPRHTVALTGSTGSLGTYLLHEMIKDDTIAHVYCLNRSADGLSKQRAGFENKSMDPNFQKATFLQVSMGEASFGLSADKYRELKSTVDIFVHNAWAVDFNMNLESFEQTHIAGVANCIKFSTGSRYRSQIVFVSSIVSVGNW